MLRRLESALLRAKVNSDFPLVLGFSGGPDSLALGHMLRGLGYSFLIAILDHQLRQESGSEVESARRVADNWQMEFVAGSANIAEVASQRGCSIETAGRGERYRFLFALAGSRGAQAVLVGHHADDQVETILMHLIRGSGIEGLAGMALRESPNSWHPTIPLIRPMLSIWRSEVLEYCAEHGLAPVRDPSNDDLDVTRNRVRHVLVPELEQFNPRARQALWRLGQIAGAENDFVEERFRERLPEIIIAGENGSAEFRRQEFLKLELALQRRLIRYLLNRYLGFSKVSFDQVERIIDWISTSPTNAVAAMGEALRTVRQADSIWLVHPDMTGQTGRAYPTIGADEIELQTAGRTLLENGWAIIAEHRGAVDEEALRVMGMYDPHYFVFPAHRVAGQRLVLRKRQPGDRIKSFGLRGKSTKVSDLFVNSKIPAAARDSWPILCNGREIVWVPGLKSTAYPPEPEIADVLVLQLVHSNQDER